MIIALRARLESFRTSLFYVPTLFVAGAIALAQGSLSLDVALSREGVRLPALLNATVDSARALLSTVAGATITFAAIAFSVSLLMFQLASSQFSPRVLYGYFRDPFSKRVMGVAVGTFTYSLLVLRAVRRPLEDGGSAVIPYVSVFLALVFGIGSILAVLAFINHSAHSMEVGEVIRRITEESRSQVAKLCPDRAGEGPPAIVEGPRPEGPGMVVRARGEGWVQQISVRKLMGAIPPGGIARLETGAGMFVPEGTPLCVIYPEPERADAAAATARDSFHLGRTRTMQQDIALGVRQLVDIALRALSPGINDPTTARESIVHLGAIMRDLLLRDLPPRVVTGGEERRLFRPLDYTYRDYVDIAFDEIRLAGAAQTAVVQALLDTLRMLAAELDDHGLRERAGYVRGKAILLLEACEAAGLRPPDLDPLRTYAERVGLVAPRRDPEP